MAFMKRIFLFGAVNILIIVTLSIVLNVLGVQPYITAYGLDYEQLMIFCLIWGMGGAFISLGLSRIMAKMMMGVKVIDPARASGAEAEIVQMVHTHAKRAGLTVMPEVGYYESPEVNAFATGPTKNRSLVAVSSGLLNRMNKDQVEGVIGHEVAHIANGDMVTMTLVQGIVNAFVMFIARIVAFAISNATRGNDDKPAVPSFLIVIVLEILLGFLGMIVVAYFSRLREFRADAGGAKLAGRDKMISALKALKGTTEMVDTEHASLASLKISGKMGGLAALFMTHPPLDERIKRLERGF